MALLCPHTSCEFFHVKSPGSQYVFENVTVPKHVETCRPVAVRDAFPKRKCCRVRPLGGPRSTKMSSSGAHATAAMASSHAPRKRQRSSHVVAGCSSVPKRAVAQRVSFRLQQ